MDVQHGTQGEAVAHAQIAAVWSMALASPSVKTVRLGKESVRIDGLKTLVLHKSG